MITSPSPPVAIDSAGLLRSARRIASARAYAWQCKEDIAQDAVMRYLERWQDETPVNPEAWLERTIRNLVIDAARREGRRPGDRPEAIALEDLASAVRSPRYASLELLRRDLVQRVLALVNTEDADVVRLRVFEGLSSREVAGQLGTTAPAVDQRFSRARRRLLAALEQQPTLLADLRSGHPQLYTTE